MTVDEWVEEQTVALTGGACSAVTVCTAKAFKRILEALTNDVWRVEFAIRLVICQTVRPGCVFPDVPFKTTGNAEGIVFSIADLTAGATEEFFIATKANRTTEEDA